MKRFLVFLLAFSACAGGLRAQISVQLRVDKEFFLLYEAIPVVVSLHNMSGRTIQLEGTTERSWLNFNVVEENGTAVRVLGRLNTEQTVLIPSGQTVSRTVDLLPLYELRTRGNYRVEAQVSPGGVQVNSMPVKFTVIQGRELWKRTVGLPSLDGGKDEYRAYSLLAHQTEKGDILYVSVKDDPPRLVYGVIQLGMFLSLMQPVVELDRDAHLHVMYQNGPRSFGYVEVDPRAKVLQRAAYSNHMSKPRLVNTNGAVAIQGGEQIYPKQERILTEEEVNPPPPPPPPPKKKSWWPFGKKSDKDERFANELKPSR